MIYLATIQAAEQQKNQALSQLHTELGFESPQALAAAIALASQGHLDGGKRPATTLGQVVTKRSGNSRKGRRVTESTLANIAASLKAGEIAATLPAKYGVSYNIVHAVKKRLGMVTPSKRGKGRKRSARIK